MLMIVYGNVGIREWIEIIVWNIEYLTIERILQGIIINWKC